LFLLVAEEMEIQIWILFKSLERISKYFSDNRKKDEAYNSTVAVYTGSLCFQRFLNVMAWVDRTPISTILIAADRSRQPTFVDRQNAASADK
jgi:hypothetical protein